MFQELPHPELGSTPVARSPFRLSTLEMSIPFRAPYLGEHNEEILSGQLGYSAERVAALYANGAITQDAEVKRLREAGKL